MNSNENDEVVASDAGPSKNEQETIYIQVRRSQRKGILSTF